LRFEEENMRTALIMSLLCLSYMAFGAIVRIAHHQMSEQTWSDQPPLVASDPAPLKLVVGRDPAGRIAAMDVQTPREALGGAERPALAFRTNLVGRGGPARASLGKGTIAPGAASSPASAETTSAAVVPIAQALPGRAGEVEARPMLSPEPIEVMEVRAAAPGRPPHRPAGAARRDLVGPPTPTFKPILPSSAPSRRTEFAWLPPPRPVLKPVLPPSGGPEDRASVTEGRAEAPVGATDDASPSGLEAWWSKLKILLASDPAPSLIDSRGPDRDPVAPGDRRDDGGGSTGVDGGGGTNEGDDGGGAGDTGSGNDDGSSGAGKVGGDQGGASDGVAGGTGGERGSEGGGSTGAGSGSNRDAGDDRDEGVERGGGAGSGIDGGRSDGKDDDEGGEDRDENDKGGGKGDRGGGKGDRGDKGDRGGGKSDRGGKGDRGGGKGDKGESKGGKGR
jgi:hypothetical protein